MTIIVETGAIVASANCYISLAEADSYHTLAGRETTWSDLDDEVKEAALIRATRALERVYKGKWVGVKTNNNTGVVNPQLLAWPRKKTVNKVDEIEDSDGIGIGINSIPQAVKDAVCEAAYLEATGSTILQGKVDTDRFLVREKTGPLEKQWNDDRPNVDVFPVLDAILQGLASPASGAVTMHFDLTDEEKTQDDLDDVLTDPDYFILV